MQEQVNELRKRAGECLDAYLAKYYKKNYFFTKINIYFCSKRFH